MVKNYWSRSWVMRRPTNIELATNKLKWRVRWRNVEAFFAHFRYGLWGWRQWWKELWGREPIPRVYGVIGSKFSLRCSKCGVLRLWQEAIPDHSMLAPCPLCGNVQEAESATDAYTGGALGVDLGYERQVNVREQICVKRDKEGPQ